MAVLNETQRNDVHLLLLRIKDVLWGTCAATKAELRQLVDACDDWIDTNASAFNTAIPVGIRNKFTAAQKAVAFAYVALKRFTG